ncbi:hypothetical protein BC833DRAFT_594735 [Globomyces pollinis-pini]|nr:hypothetical protein BC833DRAFT_594735 [Globomyces pollinis-pini]
MEIERLKELLKIKGFNAEDSLDWTMAMEEEGKFVRHLADAIYNLQPISELSVQLLKELDGEGFDWTKCTTPNEGEQILDDWDEEKCIKEIEQMEGMLKLQIHREEMIRVELQDLDTQECHIAKSINIKKQLQKDLDFDIQSLYNMLYKETSDSLNIGEIINKLHCIEETDPEFFTSFSFIFQNRTLTDQFVNIHSGYVDELKNLLNRFDTTLSKTQFNLPCETIDEIDRLRDAYSGLEYKALELDIQCHYYELLTKALEEQQKHILQGDKVDSDPTIPIELNHDLFVDSFNPFLRECKPLLDDLVLHKITSPIYSEIYQYQINSQSQLLQCINEIIDISLDFVTTLQYRSICATKDTELISSQIDSIHPLLVELDKHSNYWKGLSNIMAKYPKTSDATQYMDGTNLLIQELEALFEGQFQYGMYHSDPFLNRVKQFKEHGVELDNTQKTLIKSLYLSTNNMYVLIENGYSRNQNVQKLLDTIHTFSVSRHHLSAPKPILDSVSDIESQITDLHPRVKYLSAMGN